MRPKLTKLLRQYPDIKVEIIIDYGLTDIVAERFDAGVSHAGLSTVTPTTRTRTLPQDRAT
jgi:DNA-binding transcriptional LysR family regulator